MQTQQQVEKKRKHSDTEAPEAAADAQCAAPVVVAGEKEDGQAAAAGKTKNTTRKLQHRHGAIPWRVDEQESDSAGSNDKASEVGSNCVRAGDLVVIYERHDRMKQLRLVPGGQLQNRYGNFDHDAWIDKLQFGSIAHAKAFKFQQDDSKKKRGRGGPKRGFVYVLRPTCELWSLVLPHRTQILYVADISMVVMQLKLRPGAVVMECGTGSGSLTHALYRAVAPTGKVYTYEYHELRANQAKEEFQKHGIEMRGEAGGVHTEQRDIMELGFPTEGGFAESADAIFLDLPGPWEVIPSAAKCLKVGGTICTFSPCIEQVQRTLDAMAKENVFYRMRTMEILLRPYEVKKEKVLPFPEKEPKREWIPKSQRGKQNNKQRGKMPPGQDSEFHRSFAVPAPEVRGHTSYLTFATKVKYEQA
jgi:tRNA (adenine57-N1/adenine58-N1)-methyltransferase